MLCPKCGFDMKEDSVCEKCGWKDENNSETNDVEKDSVLSENKDDEETAVDYDSLENISLDFNEVDGINPDAEDEVNTKEDDLVVDFNAIDNKEPSDKKKKKDSTLGVALISFLAGVLATLITVGCVNGTVIGYFNKWSNGVPNDAVETFVRSTFETFDAKEYTGSCSPYFRSGILSEIQYYNSMYNFNANIDFNVDVTNDKKFESVASFYLNNFYKNDLLTRKIDKIKFGNIEYYNNDSDEFKKYIKNYSDSSDENLKKIKKITLFAALPCELSYTDIEREAQTTVTTPQTTTTKKQNSEKKNDKKATTTTTTAATTTTTAKASETTTKKTSNTQKLSVICVKIDNTWYVDQLAAAE